MREFIGHIDTYVNKFSFYISSRINIININYFEYVKVVIWVTTGYEQIDAYAVICVRVFTLQIVYQ